VLGRQGGEALLPVPNVTPKLGMTACGRFIFDSTLVSVCGEDMEYVMSLHINEAFTYRLQVSRAFTETFVRTGYADEDCLTTLQECWVETRNTGRLARAEPNRLRETQVNNSFGTGLGTCNWHTGILISWGGGAAVAG
jgi:hypothetical protein